MKRIDYNNVTALIPMGIYFKLLEEKTREDFQIVSQEIIITQNKAQYRESLQREHCSVNSKSKNMVLLSSLGNPTGAKMDNYKHFDIESTYDSTRHAQFCEKSSDISGWIILALCFLCIIVACLNLK